MLLSNVQTVAGAMYAASHAHGSPSGPSAEPIRGAQQSFGDRHVVVCGPALLQAMAAITCSHHAFIGVFVPAEDTDEHTVSNLLVIQRACDASVLLVDLEVWNDLNAALKDRWASTLFCLCSTLSVRISVQHRCGTDYWPHVRCILHFIIV